MHLDREGDLAQISLFGETVARPPRFASAPRSGGTEEHVFFTRTAAGATVASMELMRGVDEAEVLNIETLPSHRRQGLAASLLREAFAWGRMNQRVGIWLEVRTSNAAAIALYAKLGFQTVSTRKRYYSDGEDALVMKCTL